MMLKACVQNTIKFRYIKVPCEDGMRRPPSPNAVPL